MHTATHWQNLGIRKSVSNISLQIQQICNAFFCPQIATACALVKDCEFSLCFRVGCAIIIVGDSACTHVTSAWPVAIVTIMTGHSGSLAYLMVGFSFQVA